jgi:hypothetical protein
LDDVLPELGQIPQVSRGGRLRKRALLGPHLRNRDLDLTIEEQRGRERGQSKLDVRAREMTVNEFIGRARKPSRSVCRTSRLLRGYRRLGYTCCEKHELEHRLMGRRGLLCRSLRREKADGRFFDDADERAGAKVGVLGATVAAKLFDDAAGLCASK